MAKNIHDAVPEEIVVGARWWRSQISKSDAVTSAQADLFFESLVATVSASIKGHWYPEEPLRGQAYRAISLDTMNEVDAVLVKSAHRAGVTLERCFPSTIEHIIMWIDPGEVVIKIYDDKRHAIEETIFERSYNSLNARSEQTYSLAALTRRLMASQAQEEHDFYGSTEGVSVQS